MVDVGSGAGLDSFIAARAVGATGSVVGVDMTQEMLDKSRATAAELGFTNMDFREGFAEALPVDDGWADVLISNGVINLCADNRLHSPRCGECCSRRRCCSSLTSPMECPYRPRPCATSICGLAESPVGCPVRAGRRVPRGLRVRRRRVRTPRRHVQRKRPANRMLERSRCTATHSSHGAPPDSRSTSSPRTRIMSVPVYWSNGVGAVLTASHPDGPSPGWAHPGGARSTSKNEPSGDLRLRVRSAFAFGRDPLSNPRLGRVRSPHAPGHSRHPRGRSPTR